MHVGRGRFDRVGQAVVPVYAAVDLHPEIPLLPLTGLVHLRIALALLVLGRARGCDQGGIDDRALFHRHALLLQMGIHRLKDLLAKIVLLQEMAEAEDRGLIRDPLTDQVDACETTHRRHLDQGILHRWMTEVVPLLHQVNSQHGLQRVGRTATLAAGLGIVGLDQIDERIAGHNRLHLSQKLLSLGVLSRGALLLITESEPLAAHEPSSDLRSQNHCCVDPLGYPEIP